MSAGNTATPPPRMQRSNASASAVTARHPTTTRSSPARSWTIARPAEALLADQRLDRLRLRGPDLQRDRLRPGRYGRGDQPPDHVQPVRAREQRLRGLVAGDLGLQAEPLGRRRRTAGSRPPRRCRPSTGSTQVAVEELDVEAQPAGVRLRHLERAALVSVAVMCRSGRSVLSASATAPEPVPDVHHAVARREVQHRLHQVLRLGARDQHARVDLRARSSGSPCGRGCRPPARAAPAGGRTPGTVRAAAGSSPRCGSATITARSTPIAAARRSSASSRGESTLGRREGDQGGVERVSDGGSGEWGAGPLGVQCDRRLRSLGPGGAPERRLGKGVGCAGRHGQRRASAGSRSGGSRR